MKVALAKMKAELKVLAVEIRTLKSKRKELRGYVPNLGWTQSQYRIKHIAYCLLRGRTIEQIEPKLRHPESYEHTWVRKQASQLVAEVLNPPQPKPESEVKSGTEDIRPSGQAVVAKPTSCSIWACLAMFFK